jgi:hypothetical protein
MQEPEVRTHRDRRTLWDKLRFWDKAYVTTIADQHCEVTGRGPTPEAAEEAAIRRWKRAA